MGGVYLYNLDEGHPYKEPFKQKQALNDISLQDSITVEERLLKSSLMLAGTLQPLEIVNVVAPFDGSVIRKDFHYGETVEKGSLLIELNTKELEIKYRDAKASYIKVLESFQNIKDWGKSNEVLRAKRSLTKIQISVQQQKRHFDETEELFEKGIVPASEYNNAKQQYENTKMDLDSAHEEMKSVLKKGGDDKKLVAELELESARYRLDEVEEQMQKAKVFAPVEGTIILAPENANKENREISVGVKVVHGNILFSIGNLEGFSVKVDVDETEITKIQKEQAVKVSGDAFPGISLEGVVSKVSSQAKPQSDRRGVSYEITVVIKDISAEDKNRMRTGMTANLEIIMYENPEALLVPINAVLTLPDGGRYVRVRGQNSQGFNHVSVKTGKTTQDSVEIIQGLSPGDEVLIN